MATRPKRKTTYARSTRKKRSRSAWKMPNFRQMLYGMTFVGGFTGVSWFSGCNEMLQGAKNTIEEVVKIKDNQQNKPSPNPLPIPTPVIDEDSPELPAIPKKDRNRVVKHQYYTLLYNEKHEQAEWVAYILEKKSVLGKAERANNFRVDPDVPTGSAAPEDYRNSGYDRGHLAPAGDFKLNQTAMSETFFMSNMSPQLHEFNAGIWEQLESRVREWTKQRGKVYVVTGPVLEDGLPTIGQKNQVSVPKEYYKVVYDPEKQQMIGFLIPNRQSFKQLGALSMKVDDIEKKTKLDFFPAIEDDLEEQLESQTKPEEWLTEKKKPKKN